MKELGLYLKQTRIKNGVSLDEAATDLEISTAELENIEVGNVKAFKDVYELKEEMEKYARYLGIDSEVVVEEFNSFLFERTSKLSLDDIKEAQSKMNTTTKSDVKSPYTKEYKKKIPKWPFVTVILIAIFLFILLHIIFSIVNRTPKRSSELLRDIKEVNIYEFA